MQPSRLYRRLPFSLLSSQTSALLLLSSYYPLQDELTVLSDDSASSSSATTKAPETIRLNLRISLLPLELELILGITLALSYPVGEDEGRAPKTVPRPEFNLQHPTWLSRSQVGELDAELKRFLEVYLVEMERRGEEEEEGVSAQIVLDVVEFLEEEGTRLQSRIAEAKDREVALLNAAVGDNAGEEFRVWYWFPSLSTREKRDDLVNWAPDYGLTGFVLAGKPALLCLEGFSSSIDDFMKRIKSVSWADIPSFQKKVSERHRTPLLARVFDDMREITNDVEKSGARGNRGEMGQVRDWLKERGLEEDWAKVVGLGGD